MAGFDMLRHLDIFAKEPGLYVDGNLKFKSKTGAFFTFGYILLLSLLVIFQLRDFFNTSSPVTSSESFSKDIYPSVDLAKNKIIPALIVYTDETTLLPITDYSYYFTLSAHKITWQSTETNLDGSSGQDSLKLFDKINIIPCSELLAKRPELFDYFESYSYPKSLLMSYGVCLDATQDNFYVSGQATDDLWEQISLYMRPCSNMVKTGVDGAGNPILQPNCATEEELTKLNFILSMPLISYNSTKYTDPISYIPDLSEIYYITLNSMQMITGIIGQTQIKDFIGFPPKWKVRNDFFSIDDSMPYTSARYQGVRYCQPKDANNVENEVACPSYFKYTLQSSGAMHINKRTYMTLFDILSSIGGINGILMIVMEAIYRRINIQKRNEFLVNTVYPLIHNKEKEEEGMTKMERKRSRERTKSNGGNIKAPSWKNRLLNLCKRKKKTEETKAQEKKFEIALRRIESCLDIKNIVENSYKIHVLSKIFLEERHHGLAQIIDLNIFSENNENNKIIKNRENIQLNEEGVGYFNRKAVLKKIRRDMAEEACRKHKGEVEKNFVDNQHLVSDIDKRLDVFIDKFFKDNMNKSNLIFDNITAEVLNMLGTLELDLGTLGNDNANKEADNENMGIGFSAKGFSFFSNGIATPSSPEQYTTNLITQGGQSDYRRQLEIEENVAIGSVTNHKGISLEYLKQKSNSGN